MSDQKLTPFDVLQKTVCDVLRMHEGINGHKGTLHFYATTLDMAVSTLLMALPANSNTLDVVAQAVRMAYLLGRSDGIILGEKL